MGAETAKNRALARTLSKANLDTPKGSLYGFHADFAAGKSSFKDFGCFEVNWSALRCGVLRKVSQAEWHHFRGSLSK